MMMELELTCEKLRVLAPDVLRERLRIPPGKDTILVDHDGPGDLLNRLVQQDLLIEAARLLAYALPEREAVWWSCMCVLHTAPADFPAAERQATQAAEAWVRQPSEETKREAAWAAAAAGYGAPGAWPALAAYWSRPALEGDTRGGRGVDTAITRAAMRDDTSRQNERLRRFIGSGRDIASGGAGRLPPEAG